MANIPLKRLPSRGTHLTLRLVPQDCVEWGVQDSDGNVTVMAARGRDGERDANGTAAAWNDDAVPGMGYRVVSRIVETPWRGR